MCGIPLVEFTDSGIGCTGLIDSSHLLTAVLEELKRNVNLSPDTAGRLVDYVIGDISF